MTDREDDAPWSDLTDDGEVVGFSRQVADQVCIVVKLPVFDLPFYFAERLREDNVMRFGVRGFGFTDEHLR
jgi:hypothetical protein